MKSMKSILPLLVMSVMADPYAASRPNRTNYVELPTKVPDKLKNVPKPLSKKQKAKLKKTTPLTNIKRKVWIKEQ